MANTDQDIRDLTAKYQGLGILESLNISIGEGSVSSFTATILYPDLEDRLIFSGTLVQIDEETAYRPERCVAGHTWEVMEEVGVGPVALLCSECGAERKVVDGG